MRAFFAVPIEESLKRGAARLIEELRRTGADFKWVEAANLHLTLSFLGEVPETKNPALAQALEEAVGARPPFDLVFDQWGVFESWDFPRVIWLGASHGGEDLRDLAQDLHKALARLHLLPVQQPIREFKVHLTLGRMRSPFRLEPLKALMKNPPAAQGLQSRVEKVVLYQSRLSSEGPQYSVIREEKLACRA